MSEPSKLFARLSRNHLLQRGESLIGSLGLAIVTITLLIIALAGWWSVRSQQEQWTTLRRQQAQVVAETLAQSAESMLATGELSALRRLVIDAKQNHGFSACRIVLPGGGVIADAEASKINVIAFPSQWPAGPVDDLGNDAAGSPEVAEIHQPLLIPGLGAAMLTINAPLIETSSRLWETVAGIGLIGAGGLAGMLLIYRRMRNKVRTLGLIRESLLSRQKGELSKLNMALLDEFGPEAQAWNLLLDEHDGLRQCNLSDRVRESLDNRGESRGELESACDALATGLIIVDDRARIKHANGAAAPLLNMRRDDAIGKQFDELITDAELAGTVKSIAASGGARKTLEVKLPEERSGAVLRVHVRPMRRADAGGALITVEDITQQRVAEAARNSFVAQATHELRTPLTNMRLCLEAALEEETTDPGELREHLNMLNTETQRLERMVGEMLSVSQIEAGSLTLKHDEVKIDKMLDALRTDYQPQASEKKITLTFELPPKYPLLFGDRDKLMITLHNLLGNALKYTPSGGKVSVTVRTDATRLTVDVADTGLGIKPEEHQRVFEKFYRAKDQRVETITGTGLGLALAREIARLHGGDITLQSELNQGSTFTFTLPLSAASKAA
jgi:PAS domain S-box-containing protein